MGFEQALAALKTGKKVAREGWNGKHQFIELATRISYVNSDGEIKIALHANLGNSAIAFHGTSGVQIGWLASQADLLACDWFVVEKVKEEK